MQKIDKGQILQALDDLEEGKPISADLRLAVNQYLKTQVESHLDAKVNHQAARDVEMHKKWVQGHLEWEVLMFRYVSGDLTESEKTRLGELNWFFAPKD